MGRANNTTPIAAGTSANTVVRKTGGVLQRIIVTATGTNPLQVLDANTATSPSGTIIAALPASPAIGPYEFEVGCAIGITVLGSATNPAVTIVWD